MPVFAYTAIDALTGREVGGTLDCPGVEAAIDELKVRGLCPTGVQPIESSGGAMPGADAAKRRPLPGNGWLWRFRRVVGKRERAVFTRQLAALVGAGMPLVDSLDLLARQERNPLWRKVIGGLADGIRSGGTLAQGMARHPAIFDRLFVGMAAAGESGGKVDIVLERLARHLEKSGRTESRMRTAMIYPLVIMVVAAAIVVALMTFVVPRFEKIFLTVLKGAPLPALTAGVLNTSRFVQHQWPWLVGAAALAGAVGRWLRHRPAGARAFDRLLLRLPVVGDLVLKTAVARFSRTLGTLLVSGVPVLESLQLAREACGNIHLRAAVEDVRLRVREGEGMAAPLEDGGVFPVMVAGMVEVGEETGALPAMLGHVADLYDEEVDQAVASLTSLIEPVMIVLMAGIVGTIVIALFLPIIRIIQLMT